MAGLNIFLVVIVIWTVKDGAFSCSIRSHKTGPHLCSPSTSDSTSNPHPHLHTTATRLHTTIPCDSESESSSGCSSILSDRPNGLPLPPKPNIGLDTLLPAPPSVSPLTPALRVHSNHIVDIMNTLTKLLSSSPSKVASLVPQIPHAYQSVSPGLPVSNIGRVPVDVSAKPHTVHSSHHAPSSGPGPCSSSVVPSSPNAVVAPFAATPSPSLQFSIPPPASNVTLFNDSGDSPERLNVSQKPSSDVATHTAVPTGLPKVIPLSELCALFMPGYNKSSIPVQVMIPQNISRASNASYTGGCSTLPGLPCDSSSNTTLNVAEKFPGPTSQNASTPAAVPTSTPITTSTPTTVPAPACASQPNSSPVCSDRNPAISNLLPNQFLSTQAPKESPVPLTPTVSPALNMVPDTGARPRVASPGSTGPSLPPKPTSVPLPWVPTPSSTGVYSGYNPASIQLLINHLLTNPNSPLPSLSSSLLNLQPSLNKTPVFPPSQNIFQTTTSSTPKSDFNTSQFNVSPDNASVPTLTPGSTPTITPHMSLCNNPAFTNLLCKLLFSSSCASKTQSSPCLSNVHPMSLFNSSSVSTLAPSPFLTPVELLNKLSSLVSGSNVPSPYPGTVPLTPLQNLKPFSELVGKTPDTVPVLNPTPTPVSPGLNRCRQKLARLSLLSSSSASDINPCPHNIVRPSTLPLPSPHLKNYSKLGTGCKKSLLK